MNNRGYKLAFFLSVLLHVGAIAGLFIELKAPNDVPLRVENKPNIIHAVAINQETINAEIEKISQQKAQQKQAQLTLQRELAQQALQIKQQAAEKIKLQESAAKLQHDYQQKIVDLKKQQAKKNQLDAKQRHTVKKESSKQTASKQQQKDREQINLAKREADEKLLQEQVAKEQQERQRLRGEQQVIEKYKGLIVKAIGQQWLVPKNLDKSLACNLLVTLAPGGSVLSATLIKTSGDSVLDRSAIAAVFKASPLPVPTESELFDKFRELRLTVRPEGFLS